MKQLRFDLWTKQDSAILAAEGRFRLCSAGGVYGFIGKNGAGKKTFMRIACGLMKPRADVKIGKAVGFFRRTCGSRRMSGEKRCGCSQAQAAGSKSASVLERTGDRTQEKAGLSSRQLRKLRCDCNHRLPDLLVLEEPTAGSSFGQFCRCVRSFGSCTKRKHVFLSSHV